jgi:hypothetical protein
MSCFPGKLLRYFRSGFEIVPVVPIIIPAVITFNLYYKCSGMYCKVSIIIIIIIITFNT